MAIIRDGAKCTEDEFKQSLRGDLFHNVWSDDSQLAFINEMHCLMLGQSIMTPAELELIAYTYAGDTESVRRILSSAPGININVQTRVGRYTPLIIAADEGWIELVRLLLESGADPEVKNHMGRTALFVAAQGVLMCVEPLLEYGADPNITDKVGNEAFAKIFESTLEDITFDMVRLMLKHGADVDARNSAEQTPLMLCIKGNEIFPELRREMAKLLLEHGADVHARDDCGCSPMFYAVNNGRDEELIDILLDAGADMTEGHSDEYNRIRARIWGTFSPEDFVTYDDKDDDDEEDDDEGEGLDD
ncbi:MAG: ankyrin repeat domain-containing protein [Synergistaceae bacterium]|nr:ankyrin repeat domain-containing protein [Synergistaceae bacterium]